MARGEKSIDIDVSRDFFFDIVADYEKYPEFTSDVLAAKVDKVQGDESIVTFSVKVIKRIDYTLKLRHTKPERIDWSLVKGTMMKSNVGYWILEEISENQTRARYMCELKLKGLVPKSISTKLANIRLPDMLLEFKERAESLYSKV